MDVMDYLSQLQQMLAGQRPQPNYVTGTGLLPNQQFAMEQKRAIPTPSWTEAEQMAGASVGARGGSTPHPDFLTMENFVSEWAKGRMTAQQVQKEFKSRGWTADLRRGRYDVEAFDPTGKAHYLTP